MRRLVISIAAAVIFTGSVLVGIWANKTFVQANENKAQQEIQAIMPTNERIKQLQTEIERAEQEEMISGTKEYDKKVKQYVFTGESKERLDKLYQQIHEEIVKVQQRTPEQMALAVESIRAITDNPQLEVKFDGSGGNPYTSVYKKWEEWRDNNGFIYFIEPETNRVCTIQSTCTPVSFDELPKITENKLGEEKVRQIANEWLLKHVYDFEQVKKDYQFKFMSTMGAPYDVYEYRWEALSISKEEDMKPFVQVAFAQDGTFLGFMDTRPLYDIK